MEPQGKLIEELTQRLAKEKILLAADIELELIKDIDLDALVAKIISSSINVDEFKIVSRAELEKAVHELKSEKMPMPIEIERATSFRPIAADVNERVEIYERHTEPTSGGIDDFISYFRSRLERLEGLLEERTRILGTVMLKPSLLSSYASGREVCVAGMVTSNITTKKGNILVQLEDETGSAKVIFNNSTSQRARELFAEARSIVNDEVIAVRGRISGPFVIANEILWPDVPIKEPKDVDEDVAIAFVSDLHAGSKQFMEKNLLKMLDWLNGNVESKNKGLAGKIKYIIFNGDIVDGIGVYPNQEKDLAIPDMYGQYKLAFDFIAQIPDYISVFVLPGNHDVVQRAEPQPRLPKEVVGEFSSSNVHMLGNPSFLNLHEIKVLAYHGCGLDSAINAIPNSSYANPEKAMIELLKRRHLSPIYGGNVIVPSKEDNMTIDRVPDILHMGHVHKNGIANYHGVYVVNSGTWQAKTDYQVKLGHSPSPCILPVYELKTHRLTTIDFN